MVSFMSAFVLMSLFIMVFITTTLTFTVWPSSSSKINVTKNNLELNATVLFTRLMPLYS